MNVSAKNKQEVIKEYATSQTKGLTSEEAEKRLERDGKNTLHGGKKVSFFKKLLLSLCDRMTVILLLAAAVSFVTSLIGGESTADTFIILAIVVLNGFIGVIQESKAEKALEALKRMTSPHATVLRDGKEADVPTESIVKGDIIILKKGCYVAADGYLLEAVSLTADESALTGESLPVEKSTAPSAENAHLSEIKNMVRAGTVICGGSGKAVVTATGMDSYMGHIAGMLDKGSAEKTPLQQRLAKTGGMLGNCALIICGVIFIVSLIRGLPPKEMFLTSVSLAVAAIPEGLPAIVTIILSMGVKQMADKKAVVKKLPAVETLGTAAVICSDKTGTITQNKMTVTDFYGDREKAALCAFLCNNRESPTENAVFDWAEDKVKEKGKYTRIKEIPFDSDKKYMITVHKAEKGYITVKKGAPEKVIISETKETDMLAKAREYAENAKRVIAFGYCRTEKPPADPEGCVFIPCGICGMSDPPRPEVKNAVKLCRKAGIKPVMITGDHASTAAAVAREVGILRDGDKVYTEAELKDLDTPALAKAVRNCSVFARTTPEFKVRIVEAYKYGKQVVAMTGDGVNDAPALKKADIGCAMGKNGTDVAKEAADIILTDDNFSTIIEAVRYGRGIYDNIRRAVRFLLSCNIGEILTVFAAIIMSHPSPLSAIQLLWVNLVTDSLPAIALGMEKTHDSVMDRKPAGKNASLFADGLGLRIAAEGTLIGILSLCAFILGLKSGDGKAASTMCFGVLSFSQLFHAFNMRSEKPFYARGIPKNVPLLLGVILCMALQAAIMILPQAASLFGAVPLDARQWMTVACLSFAPIPLCEIFKMIKRKK